jgi:negative regulator of genetic competence, sporulation and motility
MDKYNDLERNQSYEESLELLKGYNDPTERMIELLSEYRKYLFDNPCHDELQSKATAVGIELAVRTLGLEIKGINK